MLWVRWTPSEVRNLRRRTHSSSIESFTLGELVAKISLCGNDVGDVFATTFIGCFSSFAWLVSHVLVSIAQGHLYITFVF